MPVTMMILGVVFFLAAAISFFRYESKNFDLLLLCGVIFLSAAAPSFEGDASVDELKAINHRLANIEKIVESLPKQH